MCQRYSGRVSHNNKRQEAIPAFFILNAQQTVVSLQRFVDHTRILRGINHPFYALRILR